MYPTQAHILAQLRTAVRSSDGPEGEWMRDDDVHALLRQRVPAVAHATAGELFYRLEYLRLLGFLASTQERGNAADARRHRYRLTPAYREELEKGPGGRPETRVGASPRPGGDPDERS